MRCEIPVPKGPRQLDLKGLQARLKAVALPQVTRTDCMAGTQLDTGTMCIQSSCLTGTQLSAACAGQAKLRCNERSKFSHCSCVMLCYILPGLSAWQASMMIRQSKV